MPPGSLSGQCLDTSHAGGDCSFGHDGEHSDASGCGSVRSTAELHGVTELDDSYPVSVFLSEQCDCAHCIGLLNRGLPVFLKRGVEADEPVDQLFCLLELLVCHLGEMREVEAEIIRAHE